MPLTTPKNIDWSQQPLGKLSDRELAHKLGLAKGSVNHARRLRKIPPFKRSVVAGAARPRLCEKGCETLREVVLDHMGHFPAPFIVIADRVRREWGPVSDRHLYRVLAGLKLDGKLHWEWGRWAKIR